MQAERRERSDGEQHCFRSQMQCNICGRGGVGEYVIRSHILELFHIFETPPPSSLTLDTVVKAALWKESVNKTLRNR